MLKQANYECFSKRLKIEYALAGKDSGFSIAYRKNWRGE